MKMKRRNPQISETKGGASVGYQVSTPGRVDKGYQRYPNGNGRAISRAMNNLNSALDTNNRTQIKEDVKAGAAFGMAGSELVPGEGYSEKFRESFWQSKGSREVSDFNSEITSYLSKNPNLDPGAAEAHLKGLFETRMDGKNDAYVIGFGPKAYATMKAQINGHVRIQDKRITGELLDNMGNDLVNSIGINDTAEDIHRKFLAWRSGAEATGKFTKDQMNREGLEHLTALAVDKQDLTLLDAFKVKDKDNVSIYMSGDMDLLYRKAWDTVDKAIDDAEADDEKALKKQREILEKNMDTLLDDIDAGRKSISDLENFLVTNDNSPRVHKLGTHYLTQERNGLNVNYDQGMIRQVNASPEDYTEDQVDHMYLTGQIDKVTHSGWETDDRTRQTGDFKKAMVSAETKMFEADTYNLRQFVYTPGYDEEGGPKATMNYQTMAINAFQKRVMDLPEGERTPENLKVIGKETKDHFQAQAEKSEQNPIVPMIQKYHESGGNTLEVRNIYRYYSGDPLMSNAQADAEIIKHIDRMYPPDPPKPEPTEAKVKPTPEGFLNTQELMKLPLDQRPNYDPNSGETIKRMMSEVMDWVNEGQTENKEEN